MLNIVRELFKFLWVKKKFWLFPIVIIILLFSFIIVLSQGSALAPFIYTIF